MGRTLWLLRRLQGRRDSNPQPPVLETGALPIELLPSEVQWSAVDDIRGIPNPPSAGLGSWSAAGVASLLPPPTAARRWRFPRRAVFRSAGEANAAGLAGPS